MRTRLIKEGLGHVKKKEDNQRIKQKVEKRLAEHIKGDEDMKIVNGQGEQWGCKLGIKEIIMETKGIAGVLIAFYISG